MYVLRRRCSTPSLQKRKGLPKWYITWLARSLALGQSILQVEIGLCVLWRRSVYPRCTVQSNIHKGARLEGYQIQVQHEVVTVSLGDRVILEGEKCRGIYKLKKELSSR